MSAKEYPLQTLLELACAAQRANKSYVKQVETVMASDGVTMSYVHTNRTLMLVALGEEKTTYTDPKTMPQLISTNLEDRELATEIQKYYRRLAFAAIEGDNEFKTTIHSLLNSENVPLNKIGFIACLPSTYHRDYAKTKMERIVKTIDHEYLASIGTELLDKDSEILSVARSKNFDAWNVDAIIDNRMASWMSKTSMKLGPAVIIKAKVKDHSSHWKFGIPVTRLNYVKAAQ